ncbi:UxaA family hydrolase [Microlunatus soli]|uniref:Altronate dehydratase n=1 Tax=Microlunatus soli TaxID=630515 RepID=A0A1H2ANK4_9ACTN|nr:UxaA family hydrolase [Microlunatus soli]SDT47538.1 Altronate dehydratase [Microlunatus soli]
MAQPGQGTQPQRVDFDRVAVVPEPGDNCALVSRDLEAGTVVDFGGRGGLGEVRLPHRVMEGHRFVIAPIPDGAALLSWNTPFATALRDLVPGDYVCTEPVLEALAARKVPGLPAEPSALNVPLDPYQLDEQSLVLGEQVAPVQDRLSTFAGYRRSNGTVGTRNHVVIVGVTSRSGAFATELARRLATRFPADDHFDGVVAVAHTEAGEETRPNNADFVLAVLAGTLVHPNVGAVLLVDEPGAVITSKDVNYFMEQHGYPAVIAPCASFDRHGGFENDLAEAAEIVAPWLPQVQQARRTEQPTAKLAIALQCGGSDAFSGVTANPLAGAVGGEVIKRGGIACLAETDELIAAEGYVLKNVRTPEVARKFLDTVQSFKERVSWHGHTAEGNPSGGNIYRGLYNISLKSLGAARKLPREVRVDDVINYGELFPRPGYIFMDSPGNDLESVAGQVASGSTMIFFTTGNGSITNFPFVPTMKFVTTTERYRLLSHEMDVNAGRYLDGTDFDELTTETLQQTIKVASGERTAGEKAGHSQVSIWRNWKQTGPRQGISISIDGRIGRRLEELPADERDAELPGQPVEVAAGLSDALPPAPISQVQLYPADSGYATEQLALVLPTSLCSGQIAGRLADQAAAEDWTAGRTTRAVALPHTEGCGVSGGANITTYARTMVGYLAHRSVRLALLLEHGCEKTHNDFFSGELTAAGLDPGRFGWASIQLDGGIEASGRRVQDWFSDRAAGLGVPTREDRPLSDLSVALDARGPITDEAAAALARTAGWIVAAGGTVIIPTSSRLLTTPAFSDAAFGRAVTAPTIAHGQRPAAAGWHIMRMPGTDWLETATGLGASGAELALIHVVGGTLPGHRFLPVLQVSGDSDTVAAHGPDLDGVLHGGIDQQAGAALQVLADAASGRIRAKADLAGNVGFQLTRGLLGASM